MTGIKIAKTEDWSENYPIQHDLDTLGDIAEEFTKHADTGDEETLHLKNITNTDVKHHMQDIILEGRIANLMSYHCITVRDPKQKQQICNYLSVTPEEYTEENVQTHFVEVGDFALTMYAVQTGIKGVTLRLEPLDDSPEFLQEIWSEADDEDR